MPAYIKFDGIDGESVQSDHKGEFALMSYSWGETNAGSTGGGGGAGKVSFSDVSLTMPTGQGATKLFLACAQGRHIKNAILTASRRRGGKEFTYLKMTFEDILISGYTTTGDAGGQAMNEVMVKPNIVTVEIFTQQADGSVRSEKATWDIKTNKGG